MKKLSRISSIIIIAILCLFSACKKVTHEISDQVVSINETTASTIQVGKKLKVGFITNNVTAFDFSIESEGGVLLSESITVPEGQKIIEKTFDIPLDDSWVGAGRLKVTYSAAGEAVSKSQAIIFEESNPAMYIVGGAVGAGWEPTAAALMSLYDDESKTMFETFEYITVAGDGFKFIPTNIDWVNAYGKGTTEGTLMQDEDAGNLTVPLDGFYRVRMDAEGLTYELLQLSMGIIGDATPGEWTKDTPMNFSGGKGTYVWEVLVNLIPGKIKFRANADWAINFGGTADDITQGGADIDVATAGMYLIKLDLTPGAYKASFEKQ